MRFPGKFLPDLPVVGEADGTARDIRHVLYSADLSPRLSDGGPITRPTY